MFTSERTGLFKVDSRNALELLKAPPPGAASLKSPLGARLDFTVGRENQIRVRIPVYLRDITNAYRAESYIRQGVDKYAELVTGPRLVGEQRPVDYLKKRLTAIGLAIGKPWEVLVSDVVRSYFKYANVILVKARKPVEEVPMAKRAMTKNQKAVAGYFIAPIETMVPVVDKKGNLLFWEQRPLTHQSSMMSDPTGMTNFGYSTNCNSIGSYGSMLSGEITKFNLEDTIHFVYNAQPGSIWGMSSILPVIEDVRLFRQIEENIAEMIQKNLNPLIHHQVPDVAGNGFGRQRDIDQVAANYSSMALDGIYITPPGHEIKIIGAESHALRAEGYLKHFKQRIFSGMGVSEVLMGEGATTVGTADALVAQMIFRAKYCSKELSTYFERFIFNELLYEGGFDPFNNEEDYVTLEFEEIDTEGKLKHESHQADMFTKGLITQTEGRHGIRKGPLVEGERGRQDTHVHRVQIPLEKEKGKSQLAVAKMRPRPASSKKPKKKTKKEALLDALQTLSLQTSWEELEISLRASVSAVLREEADLTILERFLNVVKREFQVNPLTYITRCEAWLNLMLDE